MRVSEREFSIFSTRVFADLRAGEFTFKAKWVLIQAWPAEL